MAWYSGFVNIFRRSTKDVVLALVAEAALDAKSRVIKDSDKPGIKAAKEEAINAVAALLVMKVNKVL
jgi:hypothetical protein